MRRLWLDFSLPMYMGLCLVLGGASAAGFVANAVLQLVAIGMIAGLAWRGQLAGLPHGNKLPLAIGVIAVGWIFIQLIPLPASLWQALPGRGPVVAGDAMLGIQQVWRPISLQPSKTLVAATSLLPPIAMFLSALTGGAKSRAGAAWIIIVVAVGCALLGVIQLSQNDAGGAYFYRITNYGATVGFFANANHLATLFLSALVISSEIPFAHSKRYDRRNLLWITVKWTLVAFFAVNIVVNGSVAGLGLLCAALVYVALRRERLRALVGQSKSAIAAICITTAAAIGVFIWHFSGKLAIFANTSVGADQRIEFAVHTVRMIVDAFPFGFGLGTFQDIYRNYENPVGVSNTFVNHAHDDYLELLAELGLPGAVLIALFALWFIRRIEAIRRTSTVSGYCYASAMVVVIVAAHSLFDYPLRTAAIAGVFAFVCGCLARPIPKDQHRVRRSLPSRRGEDQTTGRAEFQVTAAVKTDR